MSNPVAIGYTQTDQSEYTQLRSQQLPRFRIDSSLLYQQFIKGRNEMRE